MMMTCMQRGVDDNQAEEVVWHQAPSLLFARIVIIVVIIIIIIININNIVTIIIIIIIIK